MCTKRLEEGGTRAGHKKHVQDSRRGVEDAGHKDRHGSVPYRDRYSKQVDAYQQAVASFKFHNNSANMLGLLSPNFSDSPPLKAPILPSELSAPLSNRKKPDPIIPIDVNEIIRRSLDHQGQNYADLRKLRIGYLESSIQTPELRRRKAKQLPNAHT